MFLEGAILHFGENYFGSPSDLLGKEFFMDTLGMVIAIAMIILNIVGIVWLGIGLEHPFLVSLGYIIALIIIGNINKTACLIVALIVAVITLIVIIVKIVKAIIGDIEIKRCQKEKAQRNSDLLDAVNRGDKETAKRLVKEGADIYHGNGVILLESAIKNRDKDIISFLLDKGVDVNFVYEGRTPLDCAKDEEIIALLKSRGAKTKSELDAAKIKREREAREKQEAARREEEERNREAREKEETARRERCKLINACECGNLDEAKNLIQSGFDLEVRDEKGKTALMIVIDSFSDSLEKYNDVAKLLIQSGAEIDARDDKEQTAAMHSALRFWQHLPLLIESGADVNAKDKKGTTVLMWACLNSAKIAKPVEFLISKGADMNAKENSNGETALMFATAAENIEAVAALIKNGADVNIKARNGATALSVARYNGYTEIEYLLRKCGARY